MTADVPGSLPWTVARVQEVAADEPDDECEHDWCAPWSDGYQDCVLCGEVK